MNDLKNKIEKFLKDNLETLQNKYVEYRTWNCKQYARTILKKNYMSNDGATIISNLYSIAAKDIPSNLQAFIEESPHEYYTTQITPNHKIAIESAVTRYAKYMNKRSNQKIIKLKDYLLYYVTYSNNMERIEQILDNLQSIRQTNVDDKNYGNVHDWFTQLDIKVKVAEQWKKDSDKAAEQKEEDPIGNPQDANTGNPRSGAYVGTLRF